MVGTGQQMVDSHVPSTYDMVAYDAKVKHSYCSDEQSLLSIGKQEEIDKASDRRSGLEISQGRAFKSTTTREGAFS